MHDIRRVLQAAARRLLVVRMLDAIVWTVTAAMVALVLAVVADRLLTFGWSRVQWVQLFGGAVVGAALAGVAWALVVRQREPAVARIVDERAGLRESLSTALCVERETDPWSRAVVESASEKAKRVIVRDAIPIEGPRSWPLPTAAAAMLALTFFLMPQMDLRGALAKAKAADEAREEIDQAQQDALDAQHKIREIMNRTGVTLEEDKPDPELEADLQKPQTPEQIRKEAIRKLTNLTDQLQKKQESEEAKAFEAMRDLMRQLRSPGDGELSEFSRELSRGNFSKAREALEELTKKLSSGELSPEERERLAQQMQNLAQQLEQLAQQNADLQQALQQAGMTPEQAKQAAASPQALQQALQNNQNLTPQQKQQLQQMAQTMQQASSQCQSMSSAMSQMASAAASQSGQQAGQQASDAMSGQLSQMEMMQSEMMALSQSLSECQGQMAGLGQCNGGQAWGQAQGPGMTGQWQAGSSMSQGRGSGGPGKGNGAGPDSQATDFVYKTERPKVENKGGPIIGSTYVYGEQIKGEATEEFAAAVEIAAEQASEEVLTMVVDPQYRGPVKHYFGRLQERVKAQQGAAPPPAQESTTGDK
ncbi:MAG TPA: hypothetical protein VFF69_06445 [Phycisphaerales bacterium]|nr:hypothetical protein [Phycisphaerales bacterium]